MGRVVLYNEINTTTTEVTDIHPYVQHFTEMAQSEGIAIPRSPR
jgi:hypothetical protein